MLLPILIMGWAIHFAFKSLSDNEWPTLIPTLR